MLFTSWSFIALLLITLGVYYLPFLARVQVWVLILASTVFYAWESRSLLLLFWASATLNTIISYYVVHGQPERRKLIATVGVVSNLAILGFFKYGGLFGSLLVDPGSDLGRWLVQVPLPIGISFFTFEGISLLVDAYKGRDLYAYQGLVAKRWIDHARNTYFFVAFFPHLIAGPILKAHHFLPQVGRKRLQNLAWQAAIYELIVGYFLKTVVADNLKNYTNLLSPPMVEFQSTITLVMLLVGYSFQIFADFAGYSLIALGLAHLFGYDLIRNFDFPYISGSFSEFWQRWHISLSSFLREYLYIPLGGNRKGKGRTYLNLMITMLLGGFWHGAAWSYAIWGAAHGLALTAERALNDAVPQHRWPRAWWWRWIKVVFVFLVVTVLWLLFRLPRFEHVLLYFSLLTRNIYLEDDMFTIAYIFLYSAPVIGYHWLYLAAQRRAALVARWQPVLLGLLLFLILTNAGSSGTFIYFQF